jgi:hypothetical protein
MDGSDPDSVHATPWLRIVGDPFVIHFSIYVKMETMNTNPTLLSSLGIASIPFDDIAPPRATTEIRLGRNLDSDAAGKGSILYTQKFLHHAEASDALIGLSDNAGTELGIRTGDVLTVTVSVEAGSSATVSIPIAPGFTLADFAAAITAFLRGPSVNAGLGTTVELLTPAPPVSWARMAAGPEPWRKSPSAGTGSFPAVTPTGNPEAFSRSPWRISPTNGDWNWSGKTPFWKRGNPAFPCFPPPAIIPWASSPRRRSKQP